MEDEVEGETPKIVKKITNKQNRAVSLFLLLLLLIIIVIIIIHFNFIVDCPQKFN